VPPLRAFPVIYANDVSRTADFWERLGFERVVALPSESGPGYVGLRRGTSEVAVVVWDWAAQHYGLKSPAGPRFEMYVYVDELDALVTDLGNAGINILATAADMPLGGRVATIADPDGNPVTLCLAQSADDEDDTEFWLATPGFRESLIEAEADIAAGRTYSGEEIAARFGLTPPDARSERDEI
jgi:lactoylglutathione lyase